MALALAALLATLVAARPLDLTGDGRSAVPAVVRVYWRAEYIVVSAGRYRLAVVWW